MEVRIACFVKTPGLSPVKTRLAAGVGQERAEQIYRACVELMRASMSKAVELAPSGVQITPYWAVAEEAAFGHEIWSDLPTISQGTGQLGDRLDFVFRHLKPQDGGLIFIGADCPELSAELLVKAAARIAAPGDRHVLGPTDDGGYYLFGTRHQVSSEIWLGVPYSTDRTARDFTRLLLAAPEAKPVEELPWLFDLDTEEDLRKVPASFWERAAFPK